MPSRKVYLTQPAGISMSYEVDEDAPIFRDAP